MIEIMFEIRNSIDCFSFIEKFYTSTKKLFSVEIFLFLKYSTHKPLKGCDCGLNMSVHNFHCTT